MPQRKLLIVEDVYILYEELCEFFEKKGFAIIKNETETAVASYEEAVQLMKQQKPDIALLDIQLDGKKDGIDLGKYIRQRYGIPVVYISGKSNDEYVDRLIENGEDKLVCRSKPLDKDQLWYTFRLAQKKGNAIPTPVGDFLKVREVEITVDEYPVKLEAKEISYPPEKEQRVKWDMIIAIHSYNTKAAKGQNNNVLLRPDFSKKAYIMPGSLDKLEAQLPYYFARFRDNTIVNLKEATERSRANKKLFYKIRDRDFEVADTYKDKVQEKINQLLKDPGFDIPEK